MASSNTSSFEKKYPYPSEFKVREFVPELDENNYLEWKKLMLDFIECRGLASFINGKAPAPPKMVPVQTDAGHGDSSKEKDENEEYKFWERSDVLIRGWILTTLPKDTLRQVLQFKTALEVWKKLNKMFELPEAPPALANYVPLHRAAIEGDWESALKFIKKKPEGIRDSITRNKETALIVAVKSERRNYFVKNLVDMMSLEDVAKGDKSKKTALHAAAGAGNLEAAKLLVEKNGNLPNTPTTYGLKIPLFYAAARGKRKMVDYLLKVTKDETKLKGTDQLPNSQNPMLIEVDGERDGSLNLKPFEGEPGFKILHMLVTSGLYDTALTLLQKNPKLACLITTEKGDLLEFHSLLAIAQKPSSFQSGTSFNIWQRLIYWCAPVKLEKKTDHDSREDIENPADCFTSGVADDGVLVKSENVADHKRRWDIKSGFISGVADVMKRLHAICWEVFEIVPCIKHIGEKKMEHHHALELVKFICSEIVKSDYSNASKIFLLPLFQATSVGIHEIVEAILRSYPDAIDLKNQKKQSIFHQAIVCRRENVFNLIHQVGESKTIFLSQWDESKNNALHLAGYLAPQQQLYLRAGAVLQMQRELQWFKEVENHVVPRNKEHRNKEGKLPAEVFTDTHEKLVKEGEQWMKDTANACSIVAALIATVVFAAAITVPGGNNSDGHPFFNKRATFLIFGIFDALALFLSITSVLLFLSILTSRYGENDFLIILPRRLIFGLLTLFLSILSTMIAFGTTLYLVFGDSYKAWITIPIVVLSSIPVALFMFLQFPLLLDIFKSTYCSIFVKQSDRMLH